MMKKRKRDSLILWSISKEMWFCLFFSFELNKMFCLILTEIEFVFRASAVFEFAILVIVMMLMETFQPWIFLGNIKKIWTNDRLGIEIEMCCNGNEALGKKTCSLTFQTSHRHAHTPSMLTDERNINSTNIVQFSYALFL